LHDDAHEAIEIAQEEIIKFWNIYQNHWLAGMKAKLGLYNNEAEDESLINDLLQLMQQFQADYTNTFRSLTLNQKGDMELFFSADFDQWYEQWQARLNRQAETKDEIKALMKHHNPAVIPRNHRVEESLSAAEKDDLSVMNKLLRVLSDPYEYTSEQEEYSKLLAATSCCYQTFCGT